LFFGITRPNHSGGGACSNSFCFVNTVLGGPSHRDSNRLVVGLFCALSLALTSGRAFAQSDSVKDLLEKREAAAQAKVDNAIKAGSAQSVNTASISGKVLSAEGKLSVAGAQIVLTQDGNEHKRFETESDANGLFRFNNIEPGNWHITTSAKEMLSHTQAVKLAAGEVQDLSLALEDIEPVDVLRVTGKRSLIHPEKIGSETNLDHRFIQEYKSGNDLKQLIESTPGVMNDS